MDGFTTEIIEAIEEIKKSSNSKMEHTSRDMEIMFLASLLEELHCGIRSE